MFGQNPVRHKTDYQLGLYRVQASFHTLQGEGPFTGMPSVFVRLAGCNLQCAFCDTDFESGWANVMGLEALLDNIRRVSTKETRLIVITGGAPMLQDLSPLIRDLINTSGYHVQIETAGTLPGNTDMRRALENLTILDHQNFSLPAPGLSVVVSPKTPKVNQLVALTAETFKYVVSTDHTFNERGLPTHLAAPPPGTSVFIQPMDVAEPSLKQANVQLAVRLCLDHGHRLSLQTHKIVGVE